MIEGRVIADRFRLVKPLGRGGMGVVWVAHDQRLDSPCAIKFLLATLDDRARARFALEARSAAQLRSPNVVTVFDHGEADGVPYIAMELLEGEDLASRLARTDRLPPGRTLEIVEQVARALGRAHTAGLIHRDLKPANIFLARDDDREVVKVLDFGIAKAQVKPSVADDAGLAGVTKLAPSFAMTATGVSMGTPSYMSPEQIDGIDVDARTDLWALAVVAYECLTGRLPFQSESLGRLYGLVLSSEAPAPSSIAPELSAAVDAWFDRALAKDRAARFGSAREFADALRRTLASASLESSTSDARVDPTASTVAVATPEGSKFDRAAVFAPTVQHEVTPSVPTPIAVTPSPLVTGTKRFTWAALAVATLAVAAAGGTVWMVMFSDGNEKKSHDNDTDESASTRSKRSASTSARGRNGSVAPDGAAMLRPLVVGSSPIVELAAGSGHTCARLASGEVTCWGRANDGQFGTRLAAFSPPVMMPGIDDAVRVYAAGLSTCVLRKGGTLACFGALAASFGAVPEMQSDVAAVGLSLSEGVCVVKHTGKVHCIAGIDATKALDGSVAGLAGATEVAVGTRHVCALRRNGKVACWGSGDTYQLASGKIERELSPRELVGAADVVELAAGRDMTCARNRGGEVTCWGDPSYGQLGSKDYRIVVGKTPAGFDSVKSPDATRPEPVLGVPRAEEIDAGSNFSCAVSKGELRCWGLNESARLGRGTFGEVAFMIGSTPPTPAVVLTNVRQVSLGQSHACALTNSGEVHCWGSNREGQLGVQTKEFCESNFPCATKPVRVL